ncbi:hypothetical protein [Rothia sp. P4278]|uniref:hypothetical protein n=1 Tax=Rothia sp. P4278 TaxID=3402658 RepID=UPI003AEC960A
MVGKPLKVNEMPWRRMLTCVTLALAILALVGSIVGVVIAGYPAAGAFLVGLGLVYLSFFIGVLIALLTEKKSMKTAAVALAASYPFKILVFTGLLIFLPIPDGFRNGWLLAGAVTGLLVQLALETKIITKQRILYFDSVG